MCGKVVLIILLFFFFFFVFTRRRRNTILQGDWSSDVCSSDLQSSFNQVFAGIGQAEVGEYVARAGLLLKGLSFRHSSPHFSTVSRCRTRSISDFGIAIPALDFFWKAWIT